MKTTILILLALLAVGCATERKPNPMDAPDWEHHFDSATGRWEKR